MLEIIQWFDNGDRVVGLIIVMCVFFVGLSGVVRAFRKGDE